MRHISRRFPNGVKVWVETHLKGDRKYTATRNGAELGYYRIGQGRWASSGGKFMGQRFTDFYGWLRAARGAKVC